MIPPFKTPPGWRTGAGQFRGLSDAHSDPKKLSQFTFEVEQEDEVRLIQIASGDRELLGRICNAPGGLNVSQSDWQSIENLARAGFPVTMTAGSEAGTRTACLSDTARLREVYQ
ncbi:hypothetical protein C1J03_11130 [Sulfitobacter sp. SK012]|uniref:hypothetical protein n=1 Tax=Sulfitobacter sp. SK012 TaxID=1389005 RepID=UPI000E0CA1FA|nr:hypothetical protein [Sulfitobacter sp. SK012]AXI46521.1 hypothetical protein C1J03_11130 [Sulfitobacter sp. SK012]